MYPPFVKLTHQTISVPFLRNEEGTLSPHKKEEVQKQLASHFLPQVIPEYLFGTKGCSRCWRYSSEHNRPGPCPQGAAGSGGENMEMRVGDEERQALQPWRSLDPGRLWRVSTITEISMCVCVSTHAFSQGVEAEHFIIFSKGSRTILG